jgi:hypothetical protein
MIDLQSIVFLFQELRSGLRTESDIAALIAFNYHFAPAVGQTDQLAFSGASKDGGAEYRTATVVKTIANPGDGLLMTLTDGSEWKVTEGSLAGCTVKIGSQVSAEAESATALPSVGIDVPGIMEPCKLKTAFVGGW